MTETFLLTITKPATISVADMFQYPPEAVTGFLRTGVTCERCGQECRGLDRLRPGVYCNREGCRAWWTQGPLPNQGQRQPSNEVISLNWRQQHGIT